MTHREGMDKSASEADRTTASPSGSGSPGSGAGEPSSHGTLMVVFLYLLVDLLGFTVILPLIPSMLEYYSARDQVSKETLGAGV